MAEFKNKDHGLKFSVPDTITVRQQLAYLDRTVGHESMGRWLGAIGLIEDWKCKLVPDVHKLDVDAVNSFDVTGLMYFVGKVVEAHIYTLSAPKEKP